MEVDGSTELLLKGVEESVWRPPAEKKSFEISGSEKCILVDPGDGFAMDNGDSKKHLRSDRGVRIPTTLPLDPPLNEILWTEPMYHCLVFKVCYRKPIKPPLYFYFIKHYSLCYSCICNSLSFGCIEQEFWCPKCQGTSNKCHASKAQIQPNKTLPVETKPEISVRIL